MTHIKWKEEWKRPDFVVQSNYIMWFSFPKRGSYAEKYTPMKGLAPNELIEELCSQLLGKQGTGASSLLVLFLCISQKLSLSIEHSSLSKNIFKLKAIFTIKYPKWPIWAYLCKLYLSVSHIRLWEIWIHIHSHTVALKVTNAVGCLRCWWWSFGSHKQTGKERERRNRVDLSSQDCKPDPGSVARPAANNPVWVEARFLF